MFQPPEDDHSFVSLSSIQSRASTLTNNSRRRNKFPHRIIDNFQKWAFKSSSQKASHTSSISSLNSSRLLNDNELSDSCDLTSFTISEREESIVSEVIRNRKQLESLVCGHSDFARNHDSLSIDQGVVHCYISALEMAELELRSQVPLDSNGMLKMEQVNHSKNNLDRILSVRNPYRRMRLLSPSPCILAPNSRISNSNIEEDARLGFANLPEQMHRKAVKKGFNFTLMVVGESGLGKSTLINSLFVQDLYKDREIIEANNRIQSTTQIEKRQIELDERGVKLRLTVVDTPGFGDAVNCNDCWKPIEDYIDSTFEQYFKDECGLNRKNIHDHRVHCCLYFISPYGHGLRQIDVEFMRRLQHKVNIVPVIAKADALTANELRAFKERIMTDFDRYKIDIYRLPECDSDEEDEIKRLDKEIKAVLPFAVVGSNCVIDLDGSRRARGRQYPWGSVEVENSRHCDFTKLRIFLLKTHMQDLKDMTLDVHYENYRAKYITERMSKRQSDRREGVNTGALARLEKEGGTGFEAIVDQDSLLKQKEEELQRMQQLMSKMQEQLKRNTNVVPNPSVSLNNGTGNAQSSSIPVTGQQAS
ncbi:putative septin [Schistosoma mansoni]|uniref:putative septin n=1 Tax=Schistosoma mansoni TaxID=6183 RepID=UPI0001A63632|nr:putative septin [Schistosoma mansoni]|eukprot:XP_018648879.1 putative septin [Schistosoma mansoni]